MIFKPTAVRNITDLPRAQECLKYFLRVHLTVNGLDYKRHLKQLHVRPHVLLALLYFLIDRNHEAFRGKGSAQELYEKMREAVEREYPDHEQNKPEEDREGHIPVSIQESLDAFLSEEDRPRKKLRLFNDKNSTPGDKASSLSSCFDHVRHHTVTVDRSAAASTDPGTTLPSRTLRWPS